MAGMLPVQVYGLKVPATGEPIPGADSFPATVSTIVVLNTASLLHGHLQSLSQLCKAQRMRISL